MLSAATQRVGQQARVTSEHLAPKHPPLRSASPCLPSSPCPPTPPLSPSGARKLTRGMAMQLSPCQGEHLNGQDLKYRANGIG
jgi:hypothetical protein